jgi:hypothetical protein
MHLLKYNNNNNNDVIVLDITGPGLIGTTLMNVYNEKRQDERIRVRQYTVKRCLQRMNARERTLVCGNFNAYHYWWNSERAEGHVNIEVLIPWLERNTFELINIPDVPTFYRINLVRASVIDLAFATMDMRQEVRDWEAL